MLSWFFFLSFLSGFPLNCMTNVADFEKAQVPGAAGRMEWKRNGRRRIARINIHLYFSMLSFYGGYSFSYYYIFFSLCSSSSFSSSFHPFLYPKVFWLFISYALMALNFVYKSHIKDYNCVCICVFVFFSNFFFLCVLLFCLHKFHPLTLGYDCFHAENSIESVHVDPFASAA